MDLGIEGKKAIVCASSRGLGRGCAMALAENGVAVTINGRDEAKLEQTATEIRELTGVEVTAVLADISTPEGQKKLLAACPQADILVNNNGGPPRSKIDELDREQILSGLIMNMVTPIELIRDVLPHMIAQKFGRIVNITSVGVKMPVPFLDVSAGARAGLTAFCSGVSRQVAQHNVTINNLLPGFFDTDRQRAGFAATSKLTGTSVEDLAAARLRAVPVGRFGDPREFGLACAFLCSAEIGYITAQNLLIDGGRYESSFG
jgi:3-oxoacyl-[acyl-carrier protein] reductase